MFVSLCHKAMGPPQFGPAAVTWLVRTLRLWLIYTPQWLFGVVMWPGTTAPIPSGFLIHQLMPNCVCWNLSARLDQVLSMEPFSCWQGWSWSSSAEKGCWKMPEVRWPCQGLETTQLFCSSCTAQIHHSLKLGQSGGKQPEHGKSWFPELS